MDFTLATVSAFIVSILVIRWLYQRVNNYFRYNYPPGPKGWPIIGNTFNMALSRMHLTLGDHKEKYGDLSYYNWGGENFIVLNTSQVMYEAMTAAEYNIIFSGRQVSFLSEHFIPDDLSTASYSKHWAKLRKLAYTSITPRGQDVKTTQRVIWSELAVLKQDLGKMATRRFDIYEYIQRSVANIIYILIMGERFPYDHEIHGLFKIADEQSSLLSNPLTYGLLTLFPLLRFVSYGPGKVYQDTRKSLDAVLKHLYHNVTSSDFADKSGILHDMMRSREDNKWLSDGNIHDVMVNILFGGITTTSTTIYMILLILLHKPDVQKRLTDEIDEIVGRDREPSLDDQPNMYYTRAVILETFRYGSFITTVPPHAAMDDVTLRGFHLKKGSLLVANTWLIHHDEDNWDDPWAFNPDRFLDEDGSLLPPNHERRRNVVIFGLGKRRCIGDVFGPNRVFLFITHLCQKFTFYNDRMDLVSSMDPRDYDIQKFPIAPKPYELQLVVRD